MATTFVDYTGDGNATKTFSFPSYKVEDIKVEVDNVVKTVTTHYNITSYTTTGGGNVVFTSGNIPASPASIRIYRNTDVDTAKATYTAGSSVKAADLNNNMTQLLYAAQEEQNQTIIASDIKDGVITSAKITDGTIVNADVNASAAIAGTKVTPAFGSQNVSTTGTAATGALTVTGTIAVSSTVDGRDVAADGTKLDGIESSATADQTATEIKTLYESNADTNALTDAEKAVINGVTATTAEINKLDGVTASTAELNILDGVTATATELNIIDGVTATTAELNYVDGVTSNVQTQLDGKQPLDSELTELATMGSGTAGALADLNTAEVQTLDGLTSSTAELNLLDGKSIVTTIGGSATDVQIPSAQAVNERIVEVVTEVGGFVPIPNENNFPDANPDINDGAGTIVSIKALAANLVANGSGVATIANGNVSSNATITINGLTAGSTTAAGLGILVETTSTLHTYVFHRQVVDSTGVSNAQTLVSDFNDRYQISASAPSTHPDGSALGDGDLWFDTSTNIMKVYDLGNTQYDAVTSVGDFKLLTVVPDGATSGTPTFNGSIVSYDLRDSGVAANVTSVGQLIVSLNGVIQKPNSGSYNASNEGFYLEGTNGIKFCTAPAAGSSLFATLIGAATSIGTPSDNTVTEAKLTSDSVSEAKLKVSNSPVNGYFLSAQSGNTGGLTWAVVDLTALSAANLTSGTIPDARFPATLPAISGANLTNLDAADLTSGTIPDARFPATLPVADGSNLTGLASTTAGGAIYENSQTISANHTIPVGSNGMSAGPVTVNNGITLTISNGSAYTIV